MELSDSHEGVEAQQEVIEIVYRSCGAYRETVRMSSASGVLKVDEAVSLTFRFLLACGWSLESVSSAMLDQLSTVKGVQSVTVDFTDNSSLSVSRADQDRM